MFCNQCQETLRNSGCNIAKGMCGKTAETAHLQDLLLYVCKGIGYWADNARAVGYFPEEDAFFVTRMLFATITNANFAPSDFEHWIVEALKRRDRIRQEFSERGGKIDAIVPDAATWNAVDLVAIRMAAAQDKGGLLEITDEDVRALKALVLYGLKGMAAYLEHAYVLGVSSKEVFEFMFSALAKLADDTIDKEALIQLVLDTGKYGVEAMALLDKANTGSYGSPRITKVSTGVRNRPGILISGHDLRDLHDLLEQTKGTGIDVYTHGEMLPAHYYPFFEKYDNLYGNYGNAWWKQDFEIEKFHGPVLFTSNCLVPPKESYKNRIFTTGVVGFEGVTHIPDREPGKMKDFSSIIEMAKTCSPPEALEDGEIVGGFAHDQVFALADKVVETVKSGAIKRFIVMAGCDGRQPKRSYYTEVAQKLPKDTVILTAGCAKYRYNKLNLGDISGIPRVLDAGQCNDSYSLALIALKLKEAFGLDDVNKLPLSFDIAWYEQKAVTVLLALLSLGFKNIILGPTLPGFLSPNVAKVIVQTFGLQQITDADSDIAKMMA